MPCLRGCNTGDFYPRPPRGGRPTRLEIRVTPDEFLSTPSARRATLNVAAITHSSLSRFLSTPSARRATPSGYGRVEPSEFLSTPSARRATSGAGFTSASCTGFLSTPSARRATLRSEGFQLDIVISIHALREEGDSSFRHTNSREIYFYPRPPRGGRREVFVDELGTI